MANGFEPSQLQQIATGLQGFSAGIQGQLPRFQAQQNQAAQLQQQQIQQQKADEQDRAKSVFLDAQRGLTFVDEGNFAPVLELAVNRLKDLKALGSEDPSDTQRIAQLAFEANKGDKEAAELLKAELKSVVDVGIIQGILERPKEKGREDRKIIKDAEGRQRFIDSGDLVFDSATLGETVKTDKELKAQLAADNTMFDRSKTLRGEIAKSSVEFNKVDSAFARVQAATKEPSAAGDLALIFNFMKILDPGSTVREGEFATAAAAAGLSERIIQAASRVDSGERLSKNQRKDFLNQAKNLFESAKSINDKEVAKFVNIGKQQGVPKSLLLGEEIREAAKEEAQVVEAVSPVETTAQQTPEGATATNPQTNEKLVFKNGQWGPA